LRSHLSGVSRDGGLRLCPAADVLAKRHAAVPHPEDRRRHHRPGRPAPRRRAGEVGQPCMSRSLNTMTSLSVEPPEPRLTSLSHGGGCGCKIAAGVLETILRGAAALPVPPELLVGTETADDAAVYLLNERQAVVATTDFFMPIVDDPRDFGRIAATNAISDVYAMGGTPLFALAIVGMPINRISTETIGKI